MLEILLLGRFRGCGSNLQELPTKAKGLFAYLAMHRGQAIARDKLADLLWNSSSPELARHSLRQSLAALRRVLGPGGRDLITAFGAGATLVAPEEIGVDVHRFEALSQSTKLDDLATASGLYRGEFLAEFDVPSEPFMDWVRLERSRLEATACGLLQRLAAAFSDVGKHDEAIAAAQRLVTLDPLREDGHRLLMQLYVQVGRRGEAMRQFAICSDHLRRELDVAPDEKTAALANAIRTGVSTPRPALATAGASALAAPDAVAVVDADTLQHGGSDWHFDQAEKLEPTGRTRPEARSSIHPGQCRQLTVLASELTWLAARPDGEDLPEATEACYRRCAQIIEHHHGYVARCAGDGLLAYFGYPQAREQDAENSVRAALALQGLTVQLSSEFGATLQPCIGIATGMVVIADEPAARGRIALGEALTLSGRLQALAKPGQIILAQSTRRLLGRLFEYHDLGPFALKGLPAPVEAAEVLGESNIESRFEAHHLAKLTPLVGREEEIELLMRRWQRAKDTDGSVVLLVGEPGIGKSRITQTVVDLLSGERHTLLRLFCSPHHQESPLHPFINQLERAAGFCDGDTDEQRLAKLETTLRQATGDLDDAVPWFAQLLSIPAGDRNPSQPLTPQQRKEKTLRALAARVERLAASRPLLLVVEDVHWADPTSLEAIDLIIERAPRCRLLVILTSRPEFESPWAGRNQTTPMAIGRLLPRQCATIIDGVVQGKRLPKAITKEILDRADGNPLFVEELTKAVVESGALADAGDHYIATRSRPALEIPMTLHASLQARLDRIAPAREVVQIGAALGRRFSHQVIGAVAAMPQQRLDEALAGLVEAELIWRRGQPPNAEYTFKHALVQDVAYGTLRREPRRALHARIAETLANQFADIADTQPELLAHHCTEAGLVEEAAALWGKAGQMSLTRSALKEAAAQLARALGLIETLQGTAALRREQIKLQIALANALMHTKGYAAVETKGALYRARLLVEQAQALGEPPEDPLLLLSVLHGFWVASHVAFDGDAVRDLAVEFMMLAEKQKAVFPLVLGHRLMGTSLLFLGDIAEGRVHLDRAMSLYDPAQHRQLATRFGHDAGVAVLSNRPLALWLLGFPEAAIKDADDALKYAQDVGQTATFLYALTRITWIHLVIGNYAAAEQQIRQLLAVAEDMEGSYWTAAGMMLQGCLSALTGDGETAIEMITSGIAASRLTGSNLLRMPWYFSCLARAQVAVGKLDEAERCICEAMIALENTKESWQQSDIYRIAGDLALMSSEPDAAKAHYDRALAVARRQQAKSWELRAAMGLARLWRDQRKRQKARDVLIPVYEWFTQGFDTPDLRDAERLIAELA